MNLNKESLILQKINATIYERFLFRRTQGLQ